MTFAATPAIEAGIRGKSETPFFEEILEKLRKPGYSGANVPIHDKPAVTVGMSMTEKQGGSDVRANTTYATPVHSGNNSVGGEFELVGHKWFTSAPMSDGFLTLAQTQEGVSCFLVPRWLPTSLGACPTTERAAGPKSPSIARNEGFQLQRLKNKLGDKSNASSEVEYRQARGWMIGDPGRGVRTIVDMVVHTRLDCVIGSAALMRQCAQLAVHHCGARKAFGKTLSEQPLMRSVLADLSIESEAGMMLWARLAAALDGAADGDASERDFIRLATAISKYWICKRAPAVAYEAMECHGGNGYVEDGPMASLFRQSPLNAIWEGSGNIICLDVLRAVAKEPSSAHALFVELDKSKQVAPQHYGEVVDELRRTLLGDVCGDGDGVHHPARLEPRARNIVDRLAVCLQATTLYQHGDRMVADAFIATRLPDPEAPEARSSLLPVSNLGALPGLVLEPDVVSALIDRVVVHGVGKE
jgi:putative acyl-CoA dehydrogenase